MKCMGHENGFRHLELPAGASPSDTDLGYKFEEHDLDLSSVDPKSGRAWADPVLDMYVSVVRAALLGGEPVTLTYRLTRSKWESATRSSEGDRARMRDDVAKRITTDLARLTADAVTGGYKGPVIAF